MISGKSYLLILASVCLSLHAQSYPTLCNPMEYSPPGSSVHGNFQARILEWVAISVSKDLPDPGIKPTSPAWQVDSLLLSHLGSPMYRICRKYIEIITIFLVFLNKSKFQEKGDIFLFLSPN